MNSKLLLVAIVVFLGITLSFGQISQDLSDDDFGCKLLDQQSFGFCWSSCSDEEDGDGWCYTTKTRSLDYQFVKCSSDEDCTQNWSCALQCSSSMPH